MTFSADDKYECARREAQMRRRVYPRLIAQSKMSQAEADLELALMDQIAADYLAAAQQEPAGPLFGDQ